MTSSAGGGRPPQFDNNNDNNNNSDDDDDDEDDDVVVVAERTAANSHDVGERLRPLPAVTSQSRGGYDAAGPRPAAELGGGGRRAAVTQYVGKHQSSISVVEEERSTDDDPDDDDVLGGSSAGTSTAAAADYSGGGGISHDGIPGGQHHVVVAPRGARLRYHRTSLLGVPLNYRASRRDTRARRLQSRIYNFLERPKTCTAITYHVTM